MNSSDHNPPSNATRKALLREPLAIAVLFLLAIYFLAVSWRKWPDPINDAGTEWYGFWRMSLGATLYHDLAWNYGPLSAVFFSFIFKCFGPGMMVVAAANLLVYAAICALAYLAFRRAWGWPGAFAALAVFISVFSFSRLNSIANYNYATPYANEATHGMLLILLASLIAVGWARGQSNWRAFALGLCGGLATVLKPEFMLATGVLGMAAFALRWFQRQRVNLVEILLALAGLVLPTIFFTFYFLRAGSLKTAFIDASQAWWLVLVDRSQSTSAQQQLFAGLDQPGLYAWLEIKYAVLVALAILGILGAGWNFNQPKPLGRRLAGTGLGVLLTWCLIPRYNPQSLLVALLNKCHLQAPSFLLSLAQSTGHWLSIGSCFPGLIAALGCFIAWRAVRELRQSGQLSDRTAMSLVLTLLAGTMLARMALHARVHHLGFYQAALAGMVIAAFIIAEIPAWVGPAGPGRCLTAAGCTALLILGCSTIANLSRQALADQTVPIGEGRDRFYASTVEVDQIGNVVNWALDQLKPLPPGASVCVLPEGAMLNYLSRHPSPLGNARYEPQMIARLSNSPPDCVVFISRDLGGLRYGAPGGPGFDLLAWLRQNRYELAAQTGGNPLISDGPKGAVILRRQTPAN